MSPVGEAVRTASGARPAADERVLVERLQQRDEAAFAALVDRYGASMIRASLVWVSSRAVAEEIVQETWLRVLRGIDAFEGRSSLRTWIFVILGNCARRRAEVEGRSIPFTSLADDASGGADESDFFPPEHPRWAGAWSSVVDGWAAVPEERLLSAEVRTVVRDAIAALPAGQRDVMTLRDVEGWTATETCAFLGLAEGNQRVLLHRARAAVRAALRRYLEQGKGD